MSSLNIDMIRSIATSLGELNEKVVYVGGSVVELYMSDTVLSSDLRVTQDVDVVINLSTIGSYNAMEDLLRTKGFQNDMSSGAPICRWVKDDIKLDFMTDDPSILGFSNRWYKPGIEQKIPMKIGEDLLIYLFPVIYYIASKCEAVESRGMDDLRFSHDLEDIIFIISHSDELEDAFLTSENDVKNYIKEACLRMRAVPEFREAVAGSFPRGYDEEVEDVISFFNFIQSS